MVSRIERLFSLLNLLMKAERPIAADRIRERVPGYPTELASFQRQFERDKKALREMGLPIEAQDVPGVYPPVAAYRIPPEEAYLPDPGLAPDELAALHLAASAIRLDGIEGSGGLWKLGGGPTAASPGDVVDLPTDPRLVTLFEAVTNRRLACFTYRGEPRSVHPWRLDCTRGRWYLTGYDTDRSDPRHFRLDRIEGGVEVGATGGFDRPDASVPGVRMEAWQFGEGPVTQALVLVDTDWEDELRRAAPTAQRVEQREGGAVYSLTVTDPEPFRNLVLGLLHHAEVLSPPELRNDLIGWLQQIPMRFSGQ